MLGDNLGTPSPERKDINYVKFCGLSKTKDRSGHGISTEKSFNSAKQSYWGRGDSSVNKVLI